MPSDKKDQQDRTWVCRKCAEEVPAIMEMCWNCGADQDGVVDPSFEKSEPSETPIADSADRTANFRPGVCCSKCGSKKVIPGARILDQGEYSDQKLKVMIYGNPDALIMRDRMYGVLSADICGQCGHVEIKVENPEALYDHYLKSLE